MPQQFLSEATNTLIKGLITEAGELTFPKDASVDESNCDLLHDGSRRRRLGMSFEASHTESDITVDDTTLISTSVWENVGNQAGVEFLVIQTDTTVFFYQKSGDNISANRVPTSNSDSTPYTINLTSYQAPESAGAGLSRIDCASINGALVIASPEIETILVERSQSDNSFTVTEISFRIRDYEWLTTDTEDLLSENGSPTANDQREYDTYNAGWIGTPGNTARISYISSRSSWPPLSLPWYAGKDSSDNFSVTELRKIGAGNTLITNGHFILDLFAMNRGGVSTTVSGLGVIYEDGRFSTVASYAGRIFYSGITNSTNNNGSKIFFSQVLAGSFNDIGKCYQTNDPTAESYSDLLDTDGGYVLIPEAYNIKKLHVFGATLYVFAENGVWSVSGIDDVFRATAYSVSKISETGVSYDNSFVSANGRPYWWSPVGIHTLGFDGTQIVPQNLSLPTIQSFWNEIDENAKAGVSGIYDGLNNRVLWLYANNDESVATKYNNILLFDEGLGAFFPWTVSDESSATSMIVGASFYDGTGATDTEYEVVDSSGNSVVDSLGNVVIVSRTGRAWASSAVKFLVRVGGNNTLTFGEFTGIDFLDWGTADYSSYVEGGYNFNGDMTIQKNAPYITTYLKTTETGWKANGSGGYDPVRPSSCKVSVFWDFKTTASSTAQQAYRLRQIPIIDAMDLSTFGYPTTVVTTRLKARGRGRSFRVRYEGETGKDFHLLGFEVISAKNPRF